MLTEPTQAQIEAAAKVIYDDNFARLGGEWKYLSERAVIRVQCMATAKAALTAAAQVGEQSPMVQRVMEKFEDGLRKRRRNETIERCAQVAENYIPIEGIVWERRRLEIAAAIRNLKDVP